MKAKLIKYPFDIKKYRWNKYAQGKTFEFTWQARNYGFDSIRPYLKSKHADSTIVDVPYYNTQYVTDHKWTNGGYQKHYTYRPLAASGTHTPAINMELTPSTINNKNATMKAFDLEYDNQSLYVFNMETTDTWYVQPGTYSITDGNGHTRSTNVLKGNNKLYYTFKTKLHEMIISFKEYAENVPDVEAYVQAQATARGSYYDPIVNTTYTPTIRYEYTAFDPWYDGRPTYKFYITYQFNEYYMRWGYDNSVGSKYITVSEPTVTRAQTISKILAKEHYFNTTNIKERSWFSNSDDTMQYTRTQSLSDTAFNVKVYLDGEEIKSHFSPGSIPKPTPLMMVYTVRNDDDYPGIKYGNGYGFPYLSSKQ